MSDFGANIFGPDEPPVPPRRPPKPTAAEAPPAAPVRATTPEPPARRERADDDRPRAERRPDDRHATERHPGDRPRGERDRPPSHRDDAHRHRPADAERRDHGRRPHAPRGEHRPELREPPDEPRQHRDPRGPGGPRHDAPRERRAPDRTPHGGPRPAAPVRGEPAGRVALLVDVAALLAEARAQGAELSQHKLRNGIANHRAVVRAVGFAPAGVAVPTGFDAVAADAGFEGGVRFAATAFELLAAASHLVLAPATAANVQLAQALRRAGHQVELAGLAAAGPGDEPVRRLGRDCLFVP